VKTAFLNVLYLIRGTCVLVNNSPTDFNDIFIIDVNIKRGEKMAIITKITAQQKNKERYNIFIDDGKGEKYAFSVHENVLISQQLQKGKEIDELDIEEIGFADDVSKSFQHAIVFLSYRMRSSQEIIQHLKEKDYVEPVIQETVHKLKKLNYIDDEAFAIAYIKTNARISLKGPNVLKQELIQKGVSGSVIENVLSNYSVEEQLEFATKVAEKTVKKTKSSSSKIQDQKITEVLLRKGFTRDIITMILNDTVPQKDEREEWEAICQAGEKAHRRYKKFEGREYEHKIKQSLYRKGFDLDMIERYLQSEEWQETSSDDYF
jgi:regulatory protein